MTRFLNIIEFMAIVAAASLLLAALAGWLRERDVHVLKRPLRFFHRPIGEVFLVLICIGGLVHYGATKGFLGRPMMMAPREMQQELLSEPETSANLAGMFPPYTNMVTNVCATGIGVTETSVVLRTHWSQDDFFPGMGVEVYATPELTSNFWFGIGTAPIGSDEGSAIIELPYSLFPGDFLHSMFFTVGSNADTDQDGLSDFFEGLITKTDPCSIDSDRDGMSDGWEYSNGLDPASSEGDDGANGDPDGDGQSNFSEYMAGSNPKDASSSGYNPPGETIEIPLSVGSDAAAWDLEIAGNGPTDTSVRHLVMDTDLVWITNRMSFCKGNSYTVTLHWRHNDRLKNAGNRKCPWYCWELQANGFPTNAMYREDSAIRLNTHDYIVGGNYIIDNREGLFTKEVHQASLDGGTNVAERISATIYVLGDPLLVPDYNGDGEIDQSDVGILNEGRPFRFWVNDDKDDASFGGEVARNSKILDGGNDDIPASGSDGSDDKVNGRRDLVDFTPIRVDATKVLEHLPATIRDRFSFRLRQDDGALNVVWSNLSPSEANSFQTVGYTSGFGREFRSSPQESATEQVVSGGLSLPSAFEEAVKTGDGIFLVEGRRETINPLFVEAIYENRVVCSNELRMSIKSVEDMYRWLGLRSVCGDQDLPDRSTAEPTNLPDRETAGPHYVFVHGYNVNAQSARGWAAEMFKRLWQAGARSKFTAVDWYGDESQLWAGVPFGGGESLNYYINVRHALDTASVLATRLNLLTGSKVVLAHSLGNMLVSEAATHYGLVYSKYYMLNAAVPMEAYDAVALNEEMYEHGWTDVPPTKWAANWHTRIPYENDPRRTLKWKGYFAGIRNAVNCYSPTEDVLANATPNWYGGIWSFQELYKGTAALHFIPGNCEGGWGYNSDHTNLAGLLTEFAKTNDFTDTEIVASPIFRKFDNELLHQTNRITIAQTELNKVLGDGIPALSFAAGANETGGVAGNYNYQNENGTPNGWPRLDDDDNPVWEHSDLKNVAYFYVCRLFKKIVDETKHRR